jgi:uncharacterized protein YigE (DUF2233 family)
MLAAMRLFVCLALCLCQAASGLEFKKVTQAGKQFTVCRVDLRTEQLRLFLQDGSGNYFNSFENIERALEPAEQRLVFGMNAGMYHPGFAPVGWCVESGRELAPLNLASGFGNFFLKPNGVFLITARGARILESSHAAGLSEKVELATQSGPLLVEAGKIHPAFNSESTSLLLRNGVGVVEPNTVWFAISDDPVSFYQFATLFRDALHCPDALFLDGTISSLHAPALHRSDKKIDLGPIIGVVGPISKTPP